MERGVSMRIRGSWEQTKTRRTWIRQSTASFSVPGLLSGHSLAREPPAESVPQHQGKLQSLICQQCEGWGRLAVSMFH